MFLVQNCGFEKHINIERNTNIQEIQINLQKYIAKKKDASNLCKSTPNSS